MEKIDEEDKRRIKIKKGETCVYIYIYIYIYVIYGIFMIL